MRKIALLSFYDKGFAPITGLTIPHLSAYCEKWGYTPYFGQSLPQYDPCNNWHRFNATYDLFAQNFDAVMWLDGDAIITNHHIRIEDRLGNEKFVVATDLHGINAGIFIASNQPETRALLHDLIHNGKALVGDHPLQEQEALSRFLAFDRYKNLATILPQRMMNAFPHDLYDRPTDFPGNWQPGDWIIHFPGMRMHGRVEAMPRYIAQIVR